MSDDKLLLNPQPFEGATSKEKLAEGGWRFFRWQHNRESGRSEQRYMDVAVPAELQLPNLVVTPIQDSEGWFWSVVSPSRFTSKYGA